MSRKITLLVITCCIAACLLTAGCTSRTTYSESGGVTPAPTATATSAPTIQFHPVSPVTPSTTAAPRTAAPEGREQLEIQSHEMLWQGNFVYVTGTAKNIGDKRISHGSIKVKFYDADGNLVGNGLDMVSDLDAGETWKFKITTFDTDGEIEGYKIGIGSSW